jgi:hypothetical protein
LIRPPYELDGQVSTSIIGNLKNPKKRGKKFIFQKKTKKKEGHRRFNTCLPLDANKARSFMLFFFTQRKTSIASAMLKNKTAVFDQI